MNNRAIISVAANHAGELFLDIIKRKRADIATVGFTLWAYHSHAAPANAVCGVGIDRGTVYFIKATGASKSGTLTSDAATQMRVAELEWRALPTGLGPVTGRLPGLQALVLSRLEVCDTFINIGKYLDISHAYMKPARPRLGSSTIACMLSPIQKEAKLRRVIAVGSLIHPYYVDLR